MKKIIVAMFFIIFMLSTVSSIVYANPLSLTAENGIILPPAGLVFDLGASFGNTVTPGASDFTAKLSYGVFPSVTITGEFSKVLSQDDNGQKLVKVLFSPFHDDKGYTIYLGYDLKKREIPIYGLSLWSNAKYLLAFLNLQTNTQIQGTNVLMITPGANLRINSKLRLGGEAELSSNNWALQKLRVGANYSIFSKVVAKFDVERSFNGNPTQIYQAGVTVQI